MWMAVQTALEAVYQLSVSDLSYMRLRKCAAAVAGRVARAAGVPDPGLDDAAAVRGEEHAADVHQILFQCFVEDEVGQSRNAEQERCKCDQWAKEKSRAARGLKVCAVTQ